MLERHLFGPNALLLASEEKPIDNSNCAQKNETGMLSDEVLDRHSEFAICSRYLAAWHCACSPHVHI
jgi:hypothetical protein